MHTTPPSLLERLREPDAETAWTEFVVLVRQLPQFTYDRHKSFRGWLRTVTLNQWRNRRSPLRRVADSAAVLDTLACPDAVEAFGEEEYRRHLLSHALQFVRAEFPEDVWNAFERYAVQGQPADAVAAELQVRINSIYLAKSRVLARLRKELEGLLE